jgi:hypothetical protein
MTRSRIGAAAMLIATFVLGGLLGGSLTSFAERKAHEKARRPRPTYVERLAQDLGLSQDQKDRIQGILDRHQPTMDSIWVEVRQKFPQMETERVTVRQEVFAVLTPEQQEKYNAIIQRQDSIRRANGTERNRNASPSRP